MGALSLACLSCLLVHALARRSHVPTEPDFIGWLGERSSSSIKSVESKDTTGGMTVLSWQPRIFVYHSLLSVDECDEVVKLASPRLRPSGVADSTTGKQKFDEARTSNGMFFRKAETPLIETLERRISKWTMLPQENGEGMQVLRYEKAQEYRPHHDYFSHDHADDNGGNRMATVLVYLSEPEEGGETVFPKVPAPPSQTIAAGYSECAMQGLAYKPQKGDAIAFWSIQPDGRFDVKSQHGSCPVIKGEKWSATKWIHIAGLGTGKVVRQQYVPPPPPDVPGCINLNHLCEHWAESGECESNRGFMIGSKSAPGDCIKACGRCDLGPNDVAAPK